MVCFLFTKLYTIILTDCINKLEHRGIFTLNRNVSPFPSKLVLYQTHTSFINSHLSAVKGYKQHLQKNKTF